MSKTHQDYWLLFDSDVCVNVDAYDGENDPGYVTDAENEQEPVKQFHYHSSSLPFGQHLALSSITGPTYLTAQTIVQQVAFTLSDKIFSYSPETFDLDLALRHWHVHHEKNAFGYETGCESLDARSGSGSIPLGYLFSKDFNAQRRTIPQTIVASSATLDQLKPTLDQLTLLPSLLNPVVLHVAAVDYIASSSKGLVTDYTVSMDHADELGLGLVSSISTLEIQHMSLFTTLLARFLPTINIYDGIHVGRETARVVDVLNKDGLSKVYNAVSKQVPAQTTKRMDNGQKALLLLQTFNEEMGTSYEPFEYYGHSEPETVLVTFGSVEGSIAAQLAFALSNSGFKVGAINVRLYRPFIEDEFLQTLPPSVQTIAVLGQVKDMSAVLDKSLNSLLYSDVLGALALSPSNFKRPTVNQIKYSREEVWTPSKMLYVFQNMKRAFRGKDYKAMNAPERPRFDLLGPSVQRYTFWDQDDSASASVPTIVAQLFSQAPEDNVTLQTAFDNLVQGGIFRSDIRSSPKSIEAPYSISASNVLYIGSEKLLTEFDLANGLQTGGTVLINLPEASSQDTEKIKSRLGASFLTELVNKEGQVYILDSSASPSVSESPELQPLLTQLAFLRFVHADNGSKLLFRLASINGQVGVLESLSKDLDSGALQHFDLPAKSDHENTVSGKQLSSLPKDPTFNSFTPFFKDEIENASQMTNWQTVAQNFAFREVTETQNSLRPDLNHKTTTLTVKSKKRLTPNTYSRNIFHIEFDLESSPGFQYQIGEALGIHAENDEQEVRDFIYAYGLDPNEVVEVPARENPEELLETRTVLQSLLQNIDIFGRPPKKFYESLSYYASDEKQAKDLLALGTGSTGEATQEFKRRAEVDTVTYADILQEFSSARPSFAELIHLIAPMKRREYSIASSQKVTPNSVSLLIVTVNWVDPRGRDRFGQATRYLDHLAVGTPITVSLKPSVMKLPQSTAAPIIMAGLGTGLAPFRAFVQERAWQAQQGMTIGPVMLYMGSRHQKEEYLYGEEWEAYLDAGIITHLGRAFSRDQKDKIYIQDRMRESLAKIQEQYLSNEGSFYLCGPTWPVPDVTGVLQEAVESDAKEKGAKKVDSRRVIEDLKDKERFVLEVY